MLRSSISSLLIRRIFRSCTAISASSVSSKQSSSISVQTSLNYPIRTVDSGSRYRDLRCLFQWLRLEQTMAGSTKDEPKSVFDFVVKDARGNDVDLSTFKGKVLLIVNVASQCGLTNSNYTELTQLYDMYKNQGLEILAFPCNQFGGQEPGNNDQIMEFACTRFKAEFPIFEKVEVNGGDAAPFYKFLKNSKGGLLGDDIKWNFTKFLVDKDGNVVERYAPTTSPSSIEKDVKKLLGVS